MASDAFSRLPFESRWLGSIEVDPKTGCHNWTRTIDRAGYGRMCLNARSQYAHRLSWERTNGPIPEGVQVLHTCDNRRCVNPTHLFLGSIADNMRDKAKKGRAGSKLTPEQVREIRNSTGSSYKIAPKYGVDSSMIRFIRAGKWWSHID